MARDYYEVLGVGRDATDAALKKAYHKLAHRYHPDKNPGNSASEEQFKEVTEAYEVLSDSERRRQYDRFGARFQDFKGGAGFANNVGDVFSEIFSDFFGRKNERVRKKGRDRIFPLTIDLMTALKGGERELTVPRAMRCEACTGTGAAPGSAPQVCYACGGSGEIRVQQGLLSVSKKCSYCRGRGKIISKPCGVCEGHGHIERETVLKVRIPPGADDDTVLRYAGEGEPGDHGGAAGDLKVTLRVAPHPVFRREGTDLFCDVPVTITEAALGAQIEVPTLDGKVRMKVPAGTQSGRVFRLRGKGVATSENTDAGDEHVTVVVETPHALSEKARELLQALGELEEPASYPLRTAFRRDVLKSDG